MINVVTNVRTNMLPLSSGQKSGTWTPKEAVTHLPPTLDIKKDKDKIPALN
jgi:hypothetical protein